MTHIKKHFTALILLLICAFALFFRVVNLAEYPVGFQIDEASLGYNGWSLLQTGRSDEGKLFPLYVDIFGDNRPTGYHYLTTVPIAIFGLSEFSTRLPGALFGAMTVFPFFFLSLFLFKDKRMALLGAALLVLSPWSTVLSRASAETIVALFFILLGFYLVFSSLKNGGTTKLIAGTLSLLISYFFYHTPRVFVPMAFLFSALYLYWPLFNLKDRRELVRIGSVFFALCIVSALLIFFVKGGTGRFTQVNIFGFPETQLVLAEQIREDGTYVRPLIETRVFHNKAVNYSLTFVSNYFQYFSGDFLFVNGGLPPWYKVDRVGLILLIEAPFILFGAYLSFKSKNKYEKLPLMWILLAPVTAALTVDDIPNLQRAIVLFPLLELLAAVGVIGVFSKIIRYRTILIIVFFLLLLFNYSYFLHQYFVHGKQHRTWYRNNGFSQMMKIVSKNYDKYEKIILTKTGGGYPLVLFYSQYDPKKYQEEGSPRDVDYKGFGKFIFVPDECPSINSRNLFPPTTKILYVDRGTCKEPAKDKVKFADIKREDGSLGFRVVY